MEALNHFNTALRVLKEEFHKNGSFGDANSKLEEFTKLLSIYSFHELQEGEGNAIDTYLDKFAFDNSYDLLGKLTSELRNMKSEGIFRFKDNGSIFGSSVTLNSDELNSDIVFKMLNLIRVNFDLVRSRNEKFDLINEMFGYFIRDNFRNNIEDAQYMTPREVVDFIVEIAWDRMKDRTNRSDFIVCDPCSGVGSFLKSFNSIVSERGKGSILSIGQDKVIRMGRLSQLNVSFSNKKHSQFIGNSLKKGSPMDRFNGKVDLILTNPPFGAKYTMAEIGDSISLFPILSNLTGETKTVSSELLFIDRCLSLLRDKGELFIIVPDGVISSRGLAEQYRSFLMSNYNVTICSLIELPTVTFAQAGTRTKTVILHLKKDDNNERVFIGRCSNLGFEVSRRKGVTVRRKEGVNELEDVARAYQKFNRGEKKGVISENPSCVSQDRTKLVELGWTPNFHDARSYQTVNGLRNQKGIMLVDLEKIADFITKDRKREYRSTDSKCISILHVVNEDLIDLEALDSYEPKYSGIPCVPGDLLISKINPRIPRIVIVPNLKTELTCSSEFEILSAKEGLSNFQLKVLLSIPQVQLQIRSLTSGTSSSHNRIKTEQLRKVKVPIPNGKSAKSGFEIKLIEYERIYKKAIDYNTKKYRLKGEILTSI